MDNLSMSLKTKETNGENETNCASQSLNFCKKNAKFSELIEKNTFLNTQDTKIQFRVEKEKIEIDELEKKLEKIKKANKKIKKKIQISTKKSKKKEEKKKRKKSKNALKRGLKKFKIQNLKNPIKNKIKNDYFDIQKTINRNLTYQILYFYKSIKKYHKYKTKIFKKTQGIVQDLLKNFFSNKIISKIRGSFEIGLFMPISDLNLTVLNTSLINSKAAFNSLINKFQKTLRKNPDFKVLLYTQNKAVSVIKIKLIKKTTFPNIEICFKFNEKKKVKHNEEIMVEYLRLYPISRILYFALKQLLFNEKIGLPYVNGLNSFSLFLMIIHFLEMKQFPIKEKLDFEDSEKLGFVFKELFYYYTYQFDFHNWVIFTNSISNCETKNSDENFMDLKLKTFKNLRNKKFKLTILNPLKTDIVITNSFKKTDELKFFFKKFYVKFFDKNITSLNFKFKEEKKKLVTNTQKTIHKITKNKKKGQTLTV